MDRVEAVFESEIADGVVHGAAVLAGEPGRTVYARCFGFAEAEHRYPMTASTIIDIASMTKVVAATTALLICRDRGLVDFDAPFTKYLTDFSAELPGPVTVRDLAMHVSGFSHEGFPVRQYFAESGAEIMQNILRHPPLFKAGEHFEYTCWNFLLLGLIVERVTGESLKSFCRREIFEPLGMNDSSFAIPAVSDPARLAQTMGTAEPGVLSDFIAFRVCRDGLACGNAGVFSTADDLAKFARAVLRGGEYGGGRRLFSEESFREIATPRMKFGPVERSFGWIVRDEWTPVGASGRTVWHSGWSGQTLFLDQEKSRFVIVLTTRCGDYDRARRERFEAIGEILTTRF